MNKLAERIHYFDVAKGILIFMLMISHFGSATRRTGIENEWFNLLFYLQPLYACFFMQCFFIISGYCSNFNSHFSKFLKKQCKQILIPWICFEIIVKILNSLYWSNFSLDFILNQYSTPPNTGLWFFSALFFSKLYLWVMIRKKVSVPILLCSGSILLLVALLVHQYHIGPNILAIKNGLAACLYVSIGYVLKNANRGGYEFLLKLSAIIFPLSVLCLKIFKINFPILDAGVSNVGWKYFPIILIVTISGSLACLFFCKWINKCKILEYFGRNSIIIYGLHFIPLMTLVKLYTMIITPTGICTMLALIVAIYSTLLIILVLLINVFNTRYLKWMVGK